MDLYTLIILFLISYAIILIMVPFYVMRIKKESIEMNSNMKIIINLLSSKPAAQAASDVKICPSCGKNNRRDEISCIHCSARLP